MHRSTSSFNGAVADHDGEAEQAADVLGWTVPLQRSRR